MSTTTATLRPARPRGLNLAAIRLGALLLRWGQARADRAEARLTATTASPEQLRERAAAQHEARAALDQAQALARLRIR